MQKATYTYDEISQLIREDSVWEGKTITYAYDDMGNPLVYRGMTMGWYKGRELVRLTNGNTRCQYEYDVDGNRISKTVNGVKTRYYLNGSSIMTEIRGDGERFDYLYDNEGMIFEFMYKDSCYFYKKNVQGDIIGILDSNRGEIVQYQYNSWGKLISTTGVRRERLG